MTNFEKILIDKGYTLDFIDTEIVPELDRQVREEFKCDDQPIHLWERYYIGHADESDLDNIAFHQGIEDYTELFRLMNARLNELASEYPEKEDPKNKTTMKNHLSNWEKVNIIISKLVESNTDTKNKKAHVSTKLDYTSSDFYFNYAADLKIFSEMIKYFDALIANIKDDDYNEEDNIRYLNGVLKNLIQQRYHLQVRSSSNIARLTDYKTLRKINDELIKILYRALSETDLLDIDNKTVIRYLKIF